jgi:hypothetical protein
MKHLKKIIVIFSLAVLVMSCRFLDNIPNLIRDQINRFVDSPATPTIPPTPTFKLITPNESFLPPTNTPAPQEVMPATDTPEPQTLNPEGPYIHYRRKNGFWISNPDGSVLTQIFTEEFYNNFNAAVAPDGSRMALVTRDDAGYHLSIIELPSGQQTYVAQLMDGFGDNRKHPLEDPKQLVEQVLNNIRYNDDQYSSVAWQPGEGRFLAFVGAINGDTTDLYIYDTQSQEIKQLTNDPSYAILPTWSPDGAYILFYGVGWENPLGGALLGHNRLFGVWSINPDDSQLISMPKPLDILPDFVGWQDEQHYLSCDDYHLKSVDILTGLATELMPCPRFKNEISLSTTGALLLSFRSDYSESFEEGTYFLESPLSTPQKVFDKYAWEISWMTKSDVFYAYPEGLVSSDGQTVYLPPVYENSYLPAVSPQGYQAWEVHKNRQPSVQVLVPGGEWQTILHKSVGSLFWDPIDGQTLLIIDEDGRLMTAQFPDFVPEVVGNFGSPSVPYHLP